MVELTPAEITAAGVQVAEVRTAALKTDIAAFGRVEQPEAQLAAVSARIGGRVDKLYVQYTGERVRNGQAVADIYSPEVATAIEEYHLAEENRNQLKQSDDASARTQADALVKASQHKLELWGISGKQSDAPEKDGVPHVTIYSYASGTVVDRKVTQGQYVNAGDTLLTVADLNQVWIKADVYEEQLPQIRQGQEVEITAESLPNRNSARSCGFYRACCQSADAHGSSSCACCQSRDAPAARNVCQRHIRKPRCAAVHRGSTLGSARYRHAQNRVSGPAQWCL